MDDDSDEWLCSSTYKPTKDEVKSREKTPKKVKKKTPKLKVVVPNGVMSTPPHIRIERRFRKLSGVSTNNPDEHKEVQNITEVVDIDSFDTDIPTTSTQVATPSFTPKRTSLSSTPVVTPKFRNSPKMVTLRSSSDSSPIVLSRKSPGEVFANLIPKRRRSSLDLYDMGVKKQKIDQRISDDEKDPFEGIDEQKSPRSDTSNRSIDMFSTPVKRQNSSGKSDESSYFSPKNNYYSETSRKNSTQSTKYSDTCALDEDKDIQHCGEGTKEDQEEKDYGNDDVFEIEVSPEKANVPMKPKKKTITFADDVVNFDGPSEFWRTEQVIEDSCANPVVHSTCHDMFIDDETQGLFDRTNDDDTYYFNKNDTDEENNISQENSEKDEDESLFDQRQLTGLAAKFASLMATRETEKKLLMSDVAFGILPKERIKKVEVTGSASAFGVTMFNVGPSNVIFTRTSTIRRLPPFYSSISSTSKPQTITGNSAQFQNGALSSSSSSSSPSPSSFSTTAHPPPPSRSVAVSSSFSSSSSSHFPPPLSSSSSKPISVFSIGALPFDESPLIIKRTNQKVLFNPLILSDISKS